MDFEMTGQNYWNWKVRKSIGYLFSILIILLFSSCQPSSENIQNINLDIEVYSVFDDYSNAADIAQNWQTEAELMNLGITYEVIHNKEYNSIEYRFESKDLIEESFLVECKNHNCEGFIIPNNVVGDQVMSIFGYGLSPIELEKINIDSNEAMEIASKVIQFDLNGENVIYSLILDRDFDTNELQWVVTNASYSSNTTKYYAYVKVDPITGEIIDIQD